MRTGTCPFCDNDAKIIDIPATLQYRYYDCLCGEYVISKDALDDSEYKKILKTDNSKKLFSGYLRNNQGLSITNEFISKELLDIINYCNSIPLEEKISKLLHYLYKETTS